MKTCPDCGLPVRGRLCKACGWTAKKEDRAIEHCPKECMVTDCENDTVVSFVVARKENGDFIKTNGGKVLYSNGGALYERQGYTFVEWITRCPACYLRELDGMGKARIEPVEKLIEQKRNAA